MLPTYPADPSADDEVFVSYSHDSPRHEARVLELSNRLRDGGVNCWIDQFEHSPTIGWPAWGRMRIQNARFVLVVCTETYLKRLELVEEPGRGLGATWESLLITQQVHDGQGRNDKFIPVVFSPDDRKYIPDFLRRFSWYDVSDDQQFQALYAHLTGQPRVPITPLGSRRGVQSGSPADGPEEAPFDAPRAEPGPRATEFVLLQTDDATLFCPADSIAVRGSLVEIELRPGPMDAAFLSGLTPRFGARRLWAAFAESAVHGVAESVERTRVGGEERWRVTIARKTDGGEPMEVGTSEISADEIAELRARRILLDERPPSEASPWIRADPMLEALVNGLGEGPKVERSPLPPLYTTWAGPRTDFLPAARLVAVLALHASHTVEHVLELSLAWSGDDAVVVRFQGRRKKLYTNRPAAEIRVEGICRLSS
jgi:hypothetical protein